MSNKRVDKRQTKPDAGIARIGPDGLLPIREELRDHLAKQNYDERIPQRFDPNTATTEDLQRLQFSGIRINTLTGKTEAWMIGKIVGEESTEAIRKNPAVFASFHERCFQTNGTVVMLDEKEG